MVYFSFFAGTFVLICFACFNFCLICLFCYYFFHPFCLFSFFLFFFISFACFQRCHSGCQLVTLCCPVKDRRRTHHHHFNSLARRTHKGDDYEGDEDQGSKNCSILPSRMGEYGEHVEHREHGKYGKHQPDENTLSRIQNTLFVNQKRSICQREDSKHTILRHLLRRLKKHDPG